MMTMVLEQIGELLSEIGAKDTFTARRTARADDLHLEVKGLGRLRFPISRTQAQRLCDIARPARYGQGEKTLLDRQVRDTWKIPKSRVKIDKRRWNETLLPVLDALRRDLGLPFVAFYADCHHSVQPVKEGYRIVLTYNLMLKADGAATVAATEPATVEALTELMREHFETPRPPLRHWGKEEQPREPPNRLVYLLDHQYTEHGLDWPRLKGNDAARAATVRAAAERHGAEFVLALAEIHETWSCYEPGWDEPMYGRHRSWQRNEDDEWAADHDPPPADDPDAYELGELVEWGITLNRWIDPAGKKAVPIVTRVDDEEVCSTTPSSALKPYASEYEGYTGNAGNTMDRWYRRAAIVLWPRERAFAVQAEASPAWALKTLKQRIRVGKLPEAREMATSLLPFWKAATTREDGRDLFDSTLRVAEGLDAPALATSLLRPFWVEALTPGRARPLVALVQRYGEGWAKPVVADWCGDDRSWVYSDRRDPLKWLVSLPRLCEALRAADDQTGPRLARLLLQDRWRWLKKTIEERRGFDRPSHRDRALALLARPILGFLESAAVIEAAGLRDTTVSFLSASKNEPLLPCLVQMLRAADKKALPATRAAMGLAVIGGYCTRRIEARLSLPARAEGDWSIALPEGCGCELCATLGTFLTDPDEKRLDWPIAKAKRRHVHERLDAHELPVRHQTRRSGSPYTLVLTKTKALFAREAKERRSLKSELKWLVRLNSRHNG